MAAWLLYEDRREIFVESSRLSKALTSAKLHDRLRGHQLLATHYNVIVERVEPER